MFYDTRNRKNLDKLADSTRKAAYEWYQYLLDTGTEVLIYDTLRMKQQQEENVKNGVSQTMRSYHLVGQALDFVPVVDSKGGVDWNGYARADIQRAIERAKSLGFTWGGEWRSFADQPHLQYDAIGYGTDTFSHRETAATPSNAAIIRQIQETLNARYGTRLAVDGQYGPATKKALIIGLQTELNQQYHKGLAVDGSLGPATKAAIVYTKKGIKGNITWLVQAALYCKGYDPKGLDGSFGPGLEKAVRKYQEDHGLQVDGSAGRETQTHLFG